MKVMLVNNQYKAYLVNGSPLIIEDGSLPAAFRKLTGINYDGNVWYDTGHILHGSDTIRFSFKATKACNVLGCYTTASAQTNYSLYVSTTSGSKYLRYNGGTYDSYIATNTRYDVTVTPTGSSGMRNDSTWTAKTFTTESNMLIGTTSTGATSAKLTGVMYGSVIIDGVATIIPAERISDNAIGYYILEDEVFIENQGSGTPTALGYVE